jgi:hypothetical protein
MTHYPMTKEQRETFDHDLAAIMTGLSDVVTLLSACFGDNDPRLVRAKEAEAALQRLLWAVERETEPLTAGDVVVSVRAQRIVGAGSNRAERSMFDLDRG